MNRLKPDSMTTVLGLCQSLLYHFDLMIDKGGFFKKTLKFAVKNLIKELESHLDRYFKLAYGEEAQYEQADMLNVLCRCIDYGVKTSYAAAEMDEQKREDFFKEYEELFKKYGIEL